MKGPSSPATTHEPGDAGGWRFGRLATGGYFLLLASATALVWIVAWNALVAPVEFRVGATNLTVVTGTEAEDPDLWVRWRRWYVLPTIATLVAALLAVCVPWGMQRRPRFAQYVLGRRGEPLDGLARWRVLWPVLPGARGIALVGLLMMAWFLGQLPRVQRKEPMIQWPLTVGTLVIVTTAILTNIAHSRALRRELALVAMRGVRASSVCLDDPLPGQSSAPGGDGGAGI